MVWAVGLDFKLIDQTRCFGPDGCSVHDDFAIASEQQIVEDGHGRNQPHSEAILGHVCKTNFASLDWATVGCHCAGDSDGAVCWRYQAGNGVGQFALSVACNARDAHHFARVDIE